MTEMTGSRASGDVCEYGSSRARRPGGQTRSLEQERVSSLIPPKTRRSCLLVGRL